MVIFGGLWGHTTSYGDSSSNNSVQTGNNSAQSSATSITSGGATSTYGSILVSSSKNASQQQPRIIDPEAPSLTLGDFSETTLDVFYLCTVYLSTYIFIAVMAFSFVFEKWSIIDSVYFAVSTFTTVGKPAAATALVCGVSCGNMRKVALPQRLTIIISESIMI
jgi:hypothetical protein